jgi:hypothetical protein
VATADTTVEVEVLPEESATDATLREVASAGRA